MRHLTALSLLDKMSKLDGTNPLVEQLHRRLSGETRTPQTTG